MGLIRILYIYVDLTWLGGIQTYFKYLMNGITLYSKKIHPTVLSFNPEDVKLDYFKKNMIQIEILNKKYRIVDRLFLVNKFLENNFYKKIKEINPEIIHTQYHVGHIPSIRRAIRKLSEEGYIFLNTIHGFTPLGCLNGFQVRPDGELCNGLNGKKCLGCVNPLNYIYTRYLSPDKQSEFIKLLNSFKINICPSNYLQKELRKLNINNTIKLHNFVSDDFLKPINSYLEIDERINSNKYYAYVGRLHETKGLLELLTAYDKSNEDNIKLLIVGDGPLKNLIEKKSTKDKNIIFLGKIENREKLIYILKNAYCLLAPSLCLENFSMTLCEASVLGVPVIATDRGGNTEIIRNHYNGIIFPVKSRTELIKVLINFFRKKKDLDEFRNQKPIFSYKAVDHIKKLEYIYESLKNGKKFMEIKQKLDKNN